MTTIHKILILSSLIISNPFKELDKSFLFQSSSKSLPNDWNMTIKNEYVSGCIDVKKDILDDAQLQNRIDFCDCLMDQVIKILSEEEFIREIEYIKNKSVASDGFSKSIGNNPDDCLIQFIDELKNSSSKNNDTSSSQSKDQKKVDNKKINKNSFDAKIKDFDKVEGLFTFYMKKDDNSVLMEIKPGQLENIYLASFTRQSGDAYYFDGSSMMGEYPIMFKKIGKKIQAIEVNVRFRADQNLAINRAVENHISNSIIASAKILSDPHEETGAYLVDASNFFIRDVGNLSRIKSGGFKFDKSNSYYNYIKSFPNNSEIDVSIHYLSSKGKYKFTLADSKSMIHKYHISISKIPDSNYSPRLADDRVGHFLTMYQDYSDTYSESPYIRYINRWDLQKKYPELNISEPIKPIVFWIENTVPHEFRESVREGIEKWNLAFEKIGFKNAIIAKQMPDDADWDPADTRYNTIRWMIQPGSAYAVGPSRANPFTGELYDADIRIGSDFLRYFYTDFVEYIDPLQEISHTDSSHHNHNDCRYQDLMKSKMIYTWNYLLSTNQMRNSKKEMKQFVHDGIVDLILHEVGHTLGLRHNFKASSVYSMEQLSNPDFTNQYGITGSVMDYNATNLLDGGNNYFQTIPGVYDYWAIEYAYSEQPPYSTETEKDFLEKIANKSTEPLLAYGTDEDAGGRGIDPYTNRRDMTSNPIKHYAKRIDMGNEFIKDLLINFEKDGERYPRIRSIFYQGFWEYYGGARNVAKFIGGIKHSRHHVGQDFSDYPLEIIDVSKQKEALDFYKNYIFSKDAFQYSADLLNKLAPERLPDLEGDMWSMNRLDFPVHSLIENVQKTSLYSLFNYRMHNRIIDNKIKVQDGEAFELDYLFNEITKSIWDELDNKENANSFRRQLQVLHIKSLANIYSNEQNRFPHDSQSLSRLHLGKISNKIEFALEDTKFFNDYTLAHLLKSLDTINEILETDLD